MNHVRNLPANAGKLEKSGIQYIIRTTISVLLQVICLFAAAGRLNIPRAWIFFAVNFAYFIISMMLLTRFNPDLVNERIQSTSKVKSWDTLLMPMYVITAFYITPIVIGLDVGRFQWSYAGIYFIALGYLVYVITGIIGTWSMAVNPHFEGMVRIQEDREHRVISAGPYRVVRHPGYAAAVWLAPAVPLAIGSFYGLIPAAVVIIVLIIRTSLEDKTLMAELNGYTEYARQVKYRLFPGIW